MKTCLAIKAFICTLLLGLTIETDANAVTRTWVDQVSGNDANPCSRTAPCQTFGNSATGAIQKTDPNGEVNVLVDGTYGPATINQSITIDGTGRLSSITAAGGFGISVAAGATDVVILRHLTIKNSCPPASPDGIIFTGGDTLIIEDCKIMGFQNGINMTGGGKLVVRNTVITCVPSLGSSTGILINLSSGTANASLCGLSIRNTTNAAISANAGTVGVCNSVITQNSGNGILGSGSAVINCVSNILISNGTAFQALSGATIRISDNDIYNNTTAIGGGDGIIETANNNREGGNGGSPGEPTNSINIK